ncbi:MAG: hypothetical protein IPJ61_04685 [Tessaracoccus sp.]|uniref:hypothetical protein n=1 Tax=Tessaracoccus sp. TaxID=1971211 RepID=UPI001ECF1A7B|nr:hypothetical protein [Tessaracoccus sp.]MBK7820374.1 hypothetical protein [Tessaracoccus sp.]
MTLLHGIASRHDLPLPFGLVVAAGAAVLVITFWVALFAWRSPRYREEQGTELPRLTRLVDARWFSGSLRAVGLLVWGLAAAALSFGVDRIDNPSIGFVYVWLWVGLVPAALLFGQVHRRTNPLRTLLWFRGASVPSHDEPTGSLLPAAGALAVFLFLELVQPGGATVPVLRWYAAAWVLWVVVGALVTPTWIARADPFEAFATTVARLSPWARSARGLLMWTNPLRNLAAWRAPRGLAAMSSVLLGGTLFDALSNTTWWVRGTQGLQDGTTALATAALLGCMALVFGLFRLGTLAYRGLSMDELAPGLVPLVVGYALAHYGTMLYLEGQRTLFRFSDPLGKGSNLFGLIEAAPDTSLLAFPTVIAVAQVVLIVAGHALGVLVTHDIALRTAPVGATVHLPLLSVMVAFTVGGLVLMFGG